MLRIKGRIGDWPVDLTVEMDDGDWAQLAAHLPAQATAAAPAPAPVSPADRNWPLALELLQRVGSMEGPQLLAELSALAGGEAAGKRLLVRLRHCSQVQIESGAEAPLYRWVG
ncbi:MULTISPECIES: hypothetical protein [unclassified Pseudomonas]|uniref:hypothetical protein n=1 Tax=unclassified Pseudomonas TaxID=196821 RepID=UPI002449CF6D|nr:MULTISPECIES: hypothetical protein [unclassified Pseudomonas]MDG9929275.1 hypothetical protein [Pseudomonas sp. GD04042]MDH0485483.1 hypothetical protein [Pseudomonas sp. GD04015]MDH0607014.1 hypothetical protein [Pseudomonas sp. GD03869]